MKIVYSIRYLQKQKGLKCLKEQKGRRNKLLYLAFSCFRTCAFSCQTRTRAPQMEQPDLVCECLRRWSSPDNTSGGRGSPGRSHLCAEPKHGALGADHPCASRGDWRPVSCSAGGGDPAVPASLEGPHATGKWLEERKDWLGKSVVNLAVGGTDVPRMRPKGQQRVASHFAQQTVTI